MHQKNTLNERRCMQCGQSLAGHDPRRRYCSRACAVHARYPPTWLTCENCGSSFRLKPSDLDTARFCSRDCQMEARHVEASRRAYDLKDGAYSVEDRGFSTGCWIWQGSTTRGYGKIGRIGIRKSPMQAHRWMYEREIGPIPDGMVLDHLCGVTECVNPAHLEPVPQRTNVQRGRVPKYSDETIAQVKAMHKTMKGVDIARQLNIPLGTVYNLIHK